MNIPIVPLDPTAADGRHQVFPPYFSDRRFYAFRNAVLDALRSFGTVGPMGNTPLDELGQPGHMPSWKVEDSDPDYYVLDDWWFEEQMFVRVEGAPERLSQAVLQRVAALLSAHPRWAVGFALFRPKKGRQKALGLGYVLVFADRVMVDGPSFAGCATLSALTEKCSEFARSPRPGAV